jgi:hypothetical protein
MLTPNLAGRLEKLCIRDKVRVPKLIAVLLGSVRRQVTIMPGLKLILRHLSKEVFATENTAC